MKSRAARAFQISIIASRLDEIEQYHAKIEDLIAGEIAALRRRFSKEVSSWTEEERHLREDLYY